MNSQGCHGSGRNCADTVSGHTIYIAPGFLFGSSIGRGLTRDITQHSGCTWAPAFAGVSGWGKPTLLPPPPKILTNPDRHVPLLFMTDAVAMAERHSEILGELSQLGLALARDLQARAVAAADNGAACDLALAFHRVSRSVRQTLALESRLEREGRARSRDAALDAQRETQARVAARRAQVRAVLGRAIWDEAEGDEAEALLEDLEDRLADEALDEAFLTAPLDACLTRLRADLGLTAANHDGPNVVVWRSSA